MIHFGFLVLLMFVISSFFFVRLFNLMCVNCLYFLSFLYTLNLLLH